MKISRKTKIKIGKVIGFLMYSIGAGIAIGTAEWIGEQDGYDMGFRHANELNGMRNDDVVIFNEKEDK